MSNDYEITFTPDLPEDEDDNVVELPIDPEQHELLTAEQQHRTQVEANIAIARELMAQGAAPHPLVFIEERLEALIGSLMPQGSVLRARFEFLSEQMIGIRLQAAKEELNRNRLLEGVRT